MATESAGGGSSGMSEGSAHKVDDTPNSVKDILVENARSALILAGAGGDVPSDPAADAGKVASSGQLPDALNLEDVLSSVAGGNVDPGATGAYLTFEAIGGDTLVTVGFNGTADAPALTVLTLEGVTGLTLQQLLQSDRGIG